MKQLIAATLLTLLLACHAFAITPALLVHSGDDPTDLSPAAMLWHDARGEHTLADWQQAFGNSLATAPSGISAPGFVWIDATQMSLGRRTGALWMAVRVTNQQVPLLRHLVVTPARLEAVDAWLLTGPSGGSAQYLGRSGLSVPLSEQPLSGGTAAWELTLPNSPATVLLRIQSRTILQPRMSLKSPRTHALEMRRNDLNQGIYAGALALTAFLTLVFALWLRESTWIWYSANSVSLLLHQACFTGQAVLWLWPTHPQWTLPAMAVALAGAHTSIVMFFLRFIPRSHVSARGRACALGLVGMTVLGLLLVGLVGFQTGIVLQELAGLLLPFVLPWLAWRAWRRGDSPARFVLLSFGLVAISIVLRAAVLRGWMSSGPWLENWFVPLSAVLTSSVLMLAMADRVRLLQRQQALEAQHHQDMLQERIQEATTELVQARDTAQAATKFKQRFLARVSHDLRTPLHTLMGNATMTQRYLDQLAMGAPELARERLQESVQVMKRSADNVLQLADELLELARSEEGRLSLTTAPTHLPELVQELASATRWLAQHQGNQLQVHTELAVAWVVLDAARVKQVLRNLLANACAATRGGIITMGVCSTATADARTALLDVWVSDTGRGIAPEALERIFEPFEQLDVSSATGSSGLGLAIAQQWVHLMGADIAVQSTPGVGSVFSWVMQVPVVAAPPCQALPGNLVSPGQRFADTVTDELPRLQGHVLVVEDVQDHRRLLCGMLQNMGLQVSQAPSGLAAIALLEAPRGPPAQPASRIDLVFTDLNMPDGDGQSLLQWCRQHQPGLAVVALSSSAPSPDLFDADLLKPTCPVQLHQVLQRLLPPALDWAALRMLADSGDGLGVDAWLTRHRDRLGEGPLARGAIVLGDSLQLAALVRWLN